MDGVTRAAESDAEAPCREHVCILGAEKDWADGVMFRDGGCQ